MQAIAASAARLRSKSVQKAPVNNEHIPSSPLTRALLVEKHGKPHHPYPRTIAPYPLNYEKAMLDAESLDLAFRLQIYDGSPTSIPEIRVDNPKTHPRRCLDLGCSSGDWILAASRSWPNATFVGVDLVIGHQIPIHLLDQSSGQSPHDLTSTSEDSKTRSNVDTTGNPTLNHRPSPLSLASNHTPLGSRIRWVQANFLKSLPFGDGEFDYIHISGIARGVPEDKWDSLFAEISRVLAINGHLEMFEEDVIFPILPTGERATVPTPGRNGSIVSSETTGTSRTSLSSYTGVDAIGANDDKSRRASFSANRFLAAAAPKPPRMPPVPPPRLNTKLSQQSESGPSPYATTRSAEFPFGTSKSPSRGESTSGGPLETKRVPKKRCDDPAIPSGWDGPSSPVKRHAPAAIPSAWSASPQQGSFLPIGKETKSSRRPRTASSVATTLMSFSPMSPSLPFSQKIRRPTSAGSGSGRGKANGTSMDTTTPLPNSSSKRHVKQSSMTMPDAPIPVSSINHDHQILQTLFFEVYEGRFINTSPTAILPSLFNVYFQSVSVTPPIDFPAPPPPHIAREMTRRDRRNTTQREWGSGGLEQSRGLTMNLPRSIASLSGGEAIKGPDGSIIPTSSQLNNAKNQQEVLPAAADRHLKRIQSSPGLVTDSSNWLPNRNSSPFSGNSASTGGSSTSLSRNTSFLPTPVSAQSTHPYIEGAEDGLSRFGRDGILASPTGARLRHYKSATFSIERPPEQEEEDAKLAIMGDGGCFPTEEDTTEEPIERSLSQYPSLASLRSDPSLSRKDASSLKETEELPFDVLDVEGEDDGDFDHLAAEELEIFDIIGRADEPAMASVWQNGYEEFCRRVYVRPRKAFAGLGMHVPSKLLELDDLSMGVHLTRAWLNVVACKEAMWDELQRRAQVVQSPTQETQAEPTSPVMQRVTLLDEVEWIGSEKRMSDREKFELLFLRFEDDMRQWAAVGSSIPQKLSWIDPRYPNLGPVPALSTKRSTLRSSTAPHGTLSLDLGSGPGRDGMIIPGVDVCRTIRVFTGRKLVELPSGNNAFKILGIV